jgi:predicted metalloprotease with PDZ domain
MRLAKIVLYFLTFSIALFVEIFCLADVIYDIHQYPNRIHVTANFGKYTNGQSVKLYIPCNIWGADYSKQIKNIKVNNVYYNSTDSNLILDKSGNLNIEYDVINLPKDEFRDEFSNKYYHYFDSSKFFLLGLGFFVYPEHLKNNGLTEKVIIQIHSTSKKIVYNSYPYFYKKNIITNINNLSNTIILGNENFYHEDDSINGIKIITWTPDIALGKRVSTIANSVLRQQKIFWEDSNFNQIAIFIPNPFPINRNKWGGTVITDTLIGFINPKNNEDIDLYNLVNHEGLHFWFGSKLIKGPQWFTEGFVDYYMDKINYHYSGNKFEFINNYNVKLSTYFSSQLINITDKTVDDRFFSLRVIEKLPYLKGYLIAGQIDSIIDLDQTLRSLIKKCRLDKINCNFSKDLFLQNTNYQKEKIINLIDDFNKNKLINTFLQKSKLDFKKIESIKYDLDLIKIINEGMVYGKYLNKLNKNYQKDKVYMLVDVQQDCKNKMHFFIDNDGMIEEFFPSKSKVIIRIPYYHTN